MTFYHTKIVPYDFDETISKVTDALRTEGFGVLTQIDLSAKLKEKIGVEFRKYVILGACNPSLAHKALLAEDKIGVMLPCNIVIQQKSEKEVEVSSIDPEKTMAAVGSPALLPIAKEVSVKLQRVLERV